MPIATPDHHGFHDNKYALRHNNEGCKSRLKDATYAQAFAIPAIPANVPDSKSIAPTEAKALSLFGAGKNPHEQHEQYVHLSITAQIFPNCQT
jgi:hypothetical protein